VTRPWTSNSLDNRNLAKHGCGGLLLSLSQFWLLHQLPQKNDPRFKSGQKWLGNIELPLLVQIHDTLCRTVTVTL